ncbi:hypothetical protein H2248_007999 [Termitomyces sp. 'cryptogamus']|nr:hypothetical protein H2248_007999 [Termitomyces sp. 'cryptogamus']
MLSVLFYIYASDAQAAFTCLKSLHKFLGTGILESPSGLAQVSPLKGWNEVGIEEDDKRFSTHTVGLHRIVRSAFALFRQPFDGYCPWARVNGLCHCVSLVPTRMWIISPLLN